MNPVYIDISQFRSHLPRIANDIFLRGRIYVVRKSGLPIMEVKKVEDSFSGDPWDEVIGGWSKFMTEAKADKLIKNIYKWRKDGSSKKELFGSNYDVFN